MNESSRRPLSATNGREERSGVSQSGSRPSARTQSAPCRGTYPQDRHVSEWSRRRTESSHCGQVNVCVAKSAVSRAPRSLVTCVASGGVFDMCVDNGGSMLCLLSKQSSSLYAEQAQYHGLQTVDTRRHAWRQTAVRTPASSFRRRRLRGRPTYHRAGIGRNGADSEPSFGGGLSAHVTRQYPKGQSVNAHPERCVCADCSKQTKTYPRVR